MHLFLFVTWLALVLALSVGIIEEPLPFVFHELQRVLHVSINSHISVLRPVQMSTYRLILETSVFRPKTFISTKEARVFSLAENLIIAILYTHNRILRRHVHTKTTSAALEANPLATPPQVINLKQVLRALCTIPAPTVVNSYLLLFLLLLDLSLLVAKEF